LSADQTIGSSGVKFIGLGDTSNTHGVAAIPIPWDGYVTTIVGRSLEICDSGENIVFEIYLQSIGQAEEATGIFCTIDGDDATWNGQGCINTLPEEAVAALDLISVKVTNNGCPSTQVSAVIGFASGEGDLPPLPNALAPAIGKAKAKGKKN
jgi:hypothetical protein